MLNHTISIATIPGRESAVGRCVGSLPSTSPIQVYAPSVLKRTGHKLQVSRLQKALRRFSNVTIHITEEDHGSIDKLYYALHTEYEYIITVDDDAAYSSRLVPNLLEGATRYPNTALCFRAKNLEPGVPYIKTTLLEGYYRSRPRVRQVYDEQVHLLTGVGGVLYRRDFFDPEELLATSAKYPTCDDIVISAHLTARGIPIYILKLDKEHTKLKECRIHELYAINSKTDNNDRAIRDLLCPAHS